MTIFSIAVDRIEELTELDGSWQPAEYVAILEALDVEGAADFAADELRDMCLFALQDLEASEAAAVLLRHKLGKHLTDGQIRNYSVDSQHERLWEKSADLEFHHTMFAIASLLNCVNGMIFPAPDAMRVSLSIQCSDPAQLTQFSGSMDRALLVRMLSEAMDNRAILNRLFGEQIATGVIADANGIIWAVDVDGQHDDVVHLNITSSAYWLDGIRETRTFEWESELAAR
ncbi:MAG: hypothetical protein KDA91_06760 [Planctomycetaceae bacterium]|nr:hypothetical protein [Planctomycetaceae bacterium]